MPQPIFFISKLTTEKIIKSVENKGGYRYSGLSFGKSNPQAMIDLVNNLPSDDGKTVKVSKLINEIKELETTKMVGNANVAIDLIIKLINERKTVRCEGNSINGQ